MKISIVIANYNGLDYLKRTIPAFFSQSGDILEEVLIVDNGSTDGSQNYIKNSPATYLESPYKKDKNSSVNYGVEHAKSDLILLADSDLLLAESDTLQKLIEYYESLDNPGEVAIPTIDEGQTRMTNYGQFFGIPFVMQKSSKPPMEVQKLHGIEIGYASAVGILISKKVWSEVGGFDTDFTFGGDDAMLGLKLSLLGYKNYLFSKRIAVHIGAPARQDNKIYIRKLHAGTTAGIITIVKTYNRLNCLLYIPIFSLYSLIKTIKQAMARRYPQILFTYPKALLTIMSKLPSALKRRKEIRNGAKIHFDYFLTVKPPK